MYISFFRDQGSSKKLFILRKEWEVLLAEFCELLKLDKKHELARFLYQADILNLAIQRRRRCVERDSLTDFNTLRIMYIAF